MSGAEPCTRLEHPRPSEPGATFALAAMPIPPWMAAARSVRMSPNRFEATTTSRLAGSRTMRAASASTSTRSTRTPGNSAAVSRRPRPRARSRIATRSTSSRSSASHACRPRARRRKRTTRSHGGPREDARLERDLGGEPRCERPPTPAYSPSVFSRTKRKSTSSGLRPASGVGMPCQEPARTEVRPQVEPLPDREDRVPERDVIGHRRIADRAQQHRVVPAQARPARPGHHRAVSLYQAEPHGSSVQRAGGPARRPPAGPPRSPPGRPRRPGSRATLCVTPPSPPPSGTLST